MQRNVRYLCNLWHESPFMGAGMVLLHLSTEAQYRQVALKRLGVSLEQPFLDIDNFILKCSSFSGAKVRGINN